MLSTELLSLPCTVTRFYGNVEYATEVLRDGRIAFVHVSRLNDPFDPYAFFETDFEESYANLLRYVKATHPSDVGWFRAQVPVANWIRAVHELTEYMETLRRHTFVLSTCSAFDGVEPKDNLYMWGHYAAGHRGIAIEFDVSRLAASVIAEHERLNGAPFGEYPIWSRIEYAESFRPVSAADIFEFMKQEHQFDLGWIKQRGETALDQYYRRTTIIKSDVWKRENELRLMWCDDVSHSHIHQCPIAADCITNVYIGLSFAGDLGEIVGLVNRSFPKAHVLKAAKRHGNFAIDFRQA